MKKHYCTICVDYFEDIKEHHYQNHDKKIKDWITKEGKIDGYVYDLQQLSDAYIFTEVDV